MGKAIVATAKASDVTALNDILTSLQFGEKSYYMLQRPNKITDWKKGTPNVAKIEKFTHGRLFDKHRELRWQRVADDYTLLWLSKGDLPEGFTAFGEWEMSESHDVLLLGGGETEPWRDTRIPRKLDYPMAWCEEPRVRTIQYKERKSQTIHFTRYTEFVQKSGD